MIALIPARGGSRGLPGKNIRPLNGRPLIGWTILAALAAREVDRVIISTEDEAIAEVARGFGAEIPFMRPKELAGDSSAAIDTYVYTIKRLRDEGAAVDAITVLLPTTPLRTSSNIDEAIELFEIKGADSVVSYYEAPHPVQWYKYIDERGVLRSLLPEGDTLLNRQAHVRTYLPNGAIYVFRADLLVNERKYYSDRSYPYIMPVERSVDIDTLHDFELAEFYLSRRASPGI
jgi:CMP-N,N'-diacetyllegionaminic acid synthase